MGSAMEPMACREREMRINDSEKLSADSHCANGLGRDTKPVPDLSILAADVRRFGLQTIVRACSRRCYNKRSGFIVLRAVIGIERLPMNITWQSSSRLLSFVEIDL
jgi:hypothetical protein